MLNRLEVIGNLGRDPEMNYTPSGKAVTKFSLAVNQKRGGNEAETLWVNVIMWEKLAEVASQYLAKGSKVYVAGRLQVREYETKDGRKGTAVELIASELEMLTPKGEREPAGVGAGGAPLTDDDIPF